MSRTWGDAPLAANELDLPDVDDATKHEKRVARRLLGRLAPETVYVGLRLATTTRGADAYSTGTVTNVDERFCDVDWDGGGWTRFEWDKPGIEALYVLEQ